MRIGQWLNRIQQFRIGFNWSEENSEFTNGILLALKRKFKKKIEKGKGRRKRNLFVLGVELFRNVGLLVHGGRWDSMNECEQRKHENVWVSERERKMKTIQGSIWSFNALSLSPLSDRIIRMRTKHEQQEEEEERDPVPPSLTFILYLPVFSPFFWVFGSYAYRGVFVGEKNVNCFSYYFFFN